jgi:hypothetical protein
LSAAERVQCRAHSSSLGSAGKLSATRYRRRVGTVVRSSVDIGEGAPFIASNGSHKPRVERPRAMGYKHWTHAMRRNGDSTGQADKQGRVTHDPPSPEHKISHARGQETLLFWVKDTSVSSVRKNCRGSAEKPLRASAGDTPRTRANDAMGKSPCGMLAASLREIPRAIGPRPPHGITFALESKHCTQHL